MKVLVAHPQRLTGQALTAALSEGSQNEVVQVICQPDTLIDSVVAIGGEVLVLSAGYGPDLVKGGIEAFGATSVDSSSLILSHGNISEEIGWALQAGGSGYVSLECTTEQLQEAIRKAASGELVVFGVDRRRLEPVQAAEPLDAAQISGAAAMGSLTPREREVLSLLSKGFSNRQIADDLYLSEHTVRTHVQNLRSKLNVRSKFQAAVLAMQVTQARSPVSASFKL